MDMKKLQIIIVCLLLHFCTVAINFNVTTNTNNLNIPGEFDYELNQAITAFNNGSNLNVFVNITVSAAINLNAYTPTIQLNKPGTFTIRYTGVGVFQGLIVPVVSTSYFFASGVIANKTKFSIQNLKIIHPPGSQNSVASIYCANVYSVEVLNTEITESLEPIYIKENQELSVKNCTLSNSSIISNSIYGGACGINYFDEILNTVQAHVTIQNNIIENFVKGIWLQPLASYIVIDPSITNVNNYAYNGTLQNKNVNTDINISGNTINSWFFGILQDRIPSDRLSPDITYQLTIDNNIIKSEYYGVVLSAPYRHFKLTNNTISLKEDGNYYWTSSYLTESNLLPGAYQPVTFVHLVLGVPFVFNMGGYRYFANWYKNQFGFDMIYPNSTIPNQMQTNHNNIFDVIPFNNSPVTKVPMIQTFGKSLNKINLINITYPGRVVVFGGETTNIRECKFLPLNNLYYPGLTKTSPIILETVGFAAQNSNQAFNPIPLVGNLGISGPILKKATIKPGFFKVAFDLAGTQITTQNGPFVVEFFRSDITGAFTDFIGKQTISTLTSLTYSITLPIPNTVNLNPGDRIGATVTSLATNGNPTAPLPIGTSEATYIYSEPPCDCLSDFAPIPGKEYIASCWTSAQAPCQIKVSAYSGLQSNPVLIGSPFVISSSGPSIDDWTKVEGKVIIPANATILKVEIINPNNATIFADDVRFFPVDATVKSYAYDSDNIRLMAELDERNYATFYEYDEEGKLIRVKKETEKGIMTIKESRNSKATK